MYAEWGVDFVKCDDICNTNLYTDNPYSARHEIEMIAKAIQKCGRPIVLSLSPGPALIEKAWHYEKYANMWRITDDFWDNWELLKDMFHRCELWENQVSQGCYPDCDMLPLGYVGKGFGDERKTNFTYEEQKTMMTLWCVFGSPLMIGAELTKLDEITRSLLTNRDILNMLTPKCRPHQIRKSENEAIWTAYNAETNERYVALFNLADEEKKLEVSLEEIDDLPEKVNTFELWTKEREQRRGGKIEEMIPAHGCKVYQIQD